jgi:hypothetical protein
MALQLNNSIIEHRKDVLLDPSYVGPLERGMTMVDAGFNAAGKRLVAPSAAAASERPVGILMLSENTQAQVPLKEELAVPAAGPYTITLRETPDAVANMRAYQAVSGAAITIVAGAPAGGQLGLTDNVLTADVALAGLDIVVLYEHNITAAELQRRGGRRSVNQGAEGLFSQVTIGYGNCTFMVSNFDVSEAWDVDANTVVASGAAGDVVLTGGAGTDFGTLVQEPVMLQTPGITQAFIAFEANLPG